MYAFGALTRAVDPQLAVIDYGCPGESTISFTTNCDCQEADVQLHDGYPAGRRRAQPSTSSMSPYKSAAALQLTDFLGQ
jgi:hypothetical protein